MKNEENEEKKEWTKPEALDLDIDKTGGGIMTAPETSTSGAWS